MNIMGIYIYIY